jgi:hypothetical protein
MQLIYLGFPLRLAFFHARVLRHMAKAIKDYLVASGSTTPGVKQKLMVLQERIELSTSRLPSGCSTTELLQLDGPLRPTTVPQRTIGCKPSSKPWSLPSEVVPRRKRKR